MLYCLTLILSCYFLIKQKWQKLQNPIKEHVVKKKGFKGKFITSDKKETDAILEVGTTVDCFENGKLMASYGLVGVDKNERKIHEISDSR